MENKSEYELSMSPFLFLPNNPTIKSFRLFIMFYCQSRPSKVSIGSFIGDQRLNKGGEQSRLDVTQVEWLSVAFYLPHNDYYWEAAGS